MRPTGHVRICRGTEVLYDDHNLVVDSSFEAAVRALQGTDVIRRVLFADLSGRQVAASMQTLPSVVGTADVSTSGDQRPQILRDTRGRRTIGNWIAAFTAERDISYDTIGLATGSGLLFSAASLSPRVTLAKGESITVDWTISLQGN